MWLGLTGLGSGGGSRLNAPICCSWPGGAEGEGERERDAQVINNVCWKRLAAHNSWCQRLDQSSRDN